MKDFLRNIRGLNKGNRLVIPGMLFYLACVLAIFVFNLAEEAASNNRDLSESVRKTIIPVSYMLPGFPDTNALLSGTPRQIETLNAYCRETGLRFAARAAYTENGWILLDYGFSVTGSSEQIQAILSNLPGKVPAQPLYSLKDKDSIAWILTTRQVSDIPVVTVVQAALPPLRHIFRESLGTSILKAFIFLVLILPFLFLYYILFKNSREQLVRQLYTDPVTGLANRQKLIIDAQKARTPVLFLINVDSFKEVNNFYGNDFGDLFLVELGTRLKSMLPRGFRLYRTQADEHAILGDQAMTDESMAYFAASICRDVSEKVFRIMDNELYIRVTIGAARGANTQPMGVMTIWQDIASQADTALKRAKREKRNYLLFEAHMSLAREYANNLEWTRRIRKALLEDRIVPYFQPIVDNTGGGGTKYECLVRLIDDDGRAVPPVQFLDVARMSRLYYSLVETMLRKSLAAFADSDAEFSVNLSADCILDPETSENLKRIVNENARTARRLVFEILESDKIENYPEVNAFIDYVRSFGCKVAIDDFGSGYSNFEHIMRLSVDYIKIDASLVKVLEVDLASEAILRTVVDFTRKLGIKTVAEYVWSKNIYEKVRDIGIDYSQGYYFGEPAAHISKPKE